MDDNKPAPVFAEGISFYKIDPEIREKFPWKKGKVSIDVRKFMQFVREMRDAGHISAKGCIHLDLNESRKEGKPLYFQVNTWKAPETRSVDGIKEQIVQILPQGHTGQSQAINPAYGISDIERQTLNAHREAHNKANEDWTALAEEIPF